MQQHILLLIYQRGGPHLGGTGSQTFEWELRPQAPLEPPLIAILTIYPHNNENLSKFAKVISKILPIPSPPDVVQYVDTKG